MSKIYLLNYNNYYNRIVKTTTLSSYKSQAIYSADKIDFKPNDSCYTDQILNFSEAINPDYLIVTDVVGGTETLTSRWFILESRRLRGGQYNLRLRRDVFADYKSIVKDATIFCEKGYVADTDPLIFNPEGNTYNQIKTSETLLKDTTNCAWIVGYCDYKLFEGVTHHAISINATAPAWSESFSSTSALLSAYPGSDLTATWHGGTAQNTSFTVGFENTANVDRLLVMSAQQTYIQNNPTPPPQPTVCYNEQTFQNAAAVYATNDEFLSGLVNTDKGYSATNFNNLTEANGKVVRVETGTPGVYKYYRLVMRTQLQLNEYAVTNATYPTCYGYMLSFMNAAGEGGIISNVMDAMNATRVRYDLQRYTAVWQDITEALTADILDSIPRSSSSPYYMFVMPYFDCEFDDGQISTAEGSYSIPFVQSLIATVGTHVLDVQLLPYFPDQYLVHPAGPIMLDEVDSKSITWLVDGNNDRKSFIYWGAPQTFSFRISESIPTLPSKKVDNETRFCRLNAPNYSASFEFSIAKNNGVSSFAVTCTYRPYQPHLQITPIWGGVYGQYFPDGRGLICGGDYSVDIVNDAWTEYQINNKNYQLMFDRQIQTMDLQHDVQRINEKFSVGAGILSAAASGSMAGAAGGIPGMIAGGLAGGITSAVGGVLDISNNNRLRADQRSAAFDMFNYNLGNIQARPTTITKMSALVGNNKIWPFYEIYSATSREVAVLNLQLQYSGMTVGAIGTVKQYIGPSQTFIRGRLIRITGLEHDAEMSQLVADELARGIYIT